jgi:hypothetical protein
VSGTTLAAGLAFFALIGAGLGWLIARAALGGWREVVAGVARANPVLVVGPAVAAAWGWAQAVDLRTRGQSMAGAIRAEAGDNLRLLDPESPLNNIEAAAYGAGLASITCMLGLAWIVRGRAGRQAGLLVACAWLGLGLATFSLLGKGVPRYLTPLWPAMAIIGGSWVAARMERARNPRAWRIALGAAVLGLAGGEAWWYARGREAYFSHRSPRALVAELARAQGGLDRLAIVGIDAPAISFYAGRALTVFPGSEAALEAAAWIESSGSGTLVLLGARTPEEADARAAGIAPTGWRAVRAATAGRFATDKGRLWTWAYRFEAP